MALFETPRFALPLLATGQAHKELFHNDALLLLDFLIHPVVQAIENDPGSLAPTEGDCWLIGDAPVADWAGKSDQIAGWSDGGWHYIKPQESMRIIILSDHGTAIYHDANWRFIAPANLPVGGTVVDLEARMAIDSILDTLRDAKILPQIN